MATTHLTELPIMARGAGTCSAIGSNASNFHFAAGYRLPESEAGMIS